MTFLRACLAVIPFATLACDLRPKDIGNESESNGGSASGSESGGGACVDGDTKPADDGCNTCGCIDGEWACTAIGCSGDDGPAPVCEDGQQMPAPDGCNTCECFEGAWACTDMGCSNDDAPVCEDGDLMPAPDGCNTCTCEGGQWGCSEMECGQGWFGDEILVCDPGAPQDGQNVNSVTIENDVLLVEVAYGGGCETHEFGLCWDGAFAESDPVQISTFIAHDGHDDPCDAFPSEQLAFDLVPLKTAWQEGYQTESGTIEIHLDGWGESILYSF